MEKLLSEEEVKEVQGGAGKRVLSAENEEELRRVLAEADIQLSEKDLEKGRENAADPVLRSTLAGCSGCSNPRKTVAVR